MTVVCLEGPSAAGKSTVARLVAARGHAVTVGEVNELFVRPPQESATWYLERQVERWQRAVNAQSGASFVVLDGDPFQPLWYNWAYAQEGWPGLARLVDFYRPRLESGVLGFPDAYVLLRVPVPDLLNRRSGDRNRSRRNFEKHLNFIQPQARYFGVLDQLCPGYVCTIDARDTAAVAEAVAVFAHGHPTNRPSALEIFDRAIEWLRMHDARHS